MRYFIRATREYSFIVLCSCLRYTLFICRYCLKSMHNTRKAKRIETVSVNVTNGWKRKAVIADFKTVLILREWGKSQHSRLAGRLTNTRTRKLHNKHSRPCVQHLTDRRSRTYGWSPYRNKLNVPVLSASDDNNIYLLQLGCYPVAVVILHVNKTWNWLLLDLSREGYMRSL